MLRWFFKMVVWLFLAVALSIFLIDETGRTSLEWLGWRLEIRTSLLVAGFFIILFIGIYTDRLLGYILALPSRFSGYLSAANQRKGLDSAAQSLASLAIGDSRGAARHAARSRRFLGAHSLPDLLLLQSAALRGDDASQRQFFESLLKQDDFAHLGHAGLMRLENGTGNTSAALSHGRTAFRISGYLPAVGKALFSLEARAHNWPEAIKALKAAKPDLDPSQTDHYFAALYYMQAQDIGNETPNSAEQLKLLQLSLKHDEGFSPSALACAAIFGALGRPRKQISTLEKALSHRPHPDICLALFNAYGGDARALARFLRRTDKLGASNTTLLSAARFAYKLGLWGECRRLLEAIPVPERTVETWHLFADVLSHAPSGISAPWPDVSQCLELASSAKPSPHWHCGSCGHSEHDWSLTCVDCSGFLTIIHS